MQEAPLTGDAATKERKHRYQCVALCLLSLPANPLLLFFALTPFVRTTTQLAGWRPHMLAAVGAAYAVLLMFRAYKTGKSWPKGSPAWKQGLNCAVTAVILAVCLPVFMYMITMLMHGKCEANLRMHGLVCHMFANENGGMYPPLSPEPGRLAYAVGETCGRRFLPEKWLDAPGRMACPADSDYPAVSGMEPGRDNARLLDDWSYFYLGYAVASEEELRTFSKVYLERMARGEPLCGDIPVDAGAGSNGADKLLRLNADMQKPFGDEAFDYYIRVPVLIERRGNHPKGAVFVLWMRGHQHLVERGTWPNTDETMAALAAMDALSPPAK
ncbi:MAG: hypothetical protein H3C30_15365 [Candidatus Hydrogenedentes bacterium]|nr:hypothetical protein [Candidatus Hydrogenedentota bacterium]